MHGWLSFCARGFARPPKPANQGFQASPGLQAYLGFNAGKLANQGFASLDGARKRKRARPEESRKGLKGPPLKNTVSGHFCNQSYQSHTINLARVIFLIFPGSRLGERRHSLSLSLSLSLCLSVCLSACLFVCYSLFLFSGRLRIEKPFSSSLKEGTFKKTPPSTKRPPPIKRTPQ